MTIPPISLGITKGAEWLKALNAEMFSFGQAHGLMNKKAEHTSVHALAGRLQAGPSGNLELTVPSSLIKGVFDALDEPGAEFVVRNNRTESAIKVMTKEEVDKLGGTSHITERGHSYHYTLGPIVELPATGDYDKLWAISIKSNDLEDIRKSYGLETSPQLGFYIPVGCKKSKVTEDNEVSKLAGVFYHSTLKDRVDSILEKGLDPSFAGTGADTGVPDMCSDYERLVFLTKHPTIQGGYGPASFEVNLPDDFPVRRLPLQWMSGDYVTSKPIPPEYIKLRGAENSVSKLAGLLNPWHKQVQHFIGQGYTPIAAPDGNVTFKKGDKYYSWAHDAMDGQLKEVSPADAAADLEYSGPWNEPELSSVSKLAGVFYHGSPKGDLQRLFKGSYVTPDLDTAKLMARFHEDTGKPWTDDDLEESYEFGTPQPKWKAGREPKGEPAIYRLIAATKKLNLLDNPWEHTTLEEMPVSKLAGAAEDPMYLHSYIPSGSIKHVKEHGLLSGNELAKPENRHLLDIARPNGDADRWLKEREEKLIKSPWANTYNGPSVLFGDLDPDKIHDKHPIKKFNTTRARINLHALLKDYPTTKLEGSELIPFSDEVYDALDEKGQNEFVNKRHHTLSPEEIKSLIARGQNPKDMWKDFKDTEGKYYASDVPHAKVVTPMGKIPSKYIEFDEEAPVSKLAGLLKQSVYWSKDVSRDLLNGRKYPLSYLTGELGELGESVKNMDWTNFKEELGDSAYAAQMILAQKLGLNLPLIGASAPVDKFYARRKGWEEVFKERGVPFSNDYLAGGSNLKKPKKIQAALGLAGHAISKEDARTASLKYGGGIEDDWVDDIGGVTDTTNTPYAGSDTNRSSTIRPEG